MTKGLQNSANFERENFSIGHCHRCYWIDLWTKGIWHAYLHAERYAGSLHERSIGQLLAGVWLQPIRCKSYVNMSAHEATLMCASMLCLATLAYHRLLSNALYGGRQKYAGIILYC